MRGACGASFQPHPPVWLHQTGGKTVHGQGGGCSPNPGWRLHKDRLPSQGRSTRTPPPPTLQDIHAADPNNSTFEMYQEIPDAVPFDISGADVEVVARCINSSDIPGVADAKVLRNWCTRFSSESEHIREELSLWAEYLENSPPPPGWPYER